MFNTIFPKTLFTGRNSIVLPTCHSTNDYSLNLLSQQEVPEGTIIITKNQTDGKGQRGNKWESEPFKNLTFSIVIKPGFVPIQHQFYLNIITSLAVHQTLTQLIKKKISIKWPNDIYINDKKVCGILIQNVLKGKNISTSVVGIGLNVNQNSFTLPTATSLSIENNTVFDLNNVLHNVLENFEKFYLLLKAQDFLKLKNLYLEKLYWLNEVHDFYSDKSFKGKIIGISENGLLEILTENKVQSFNFKEIAFVK